MEFGQLSKRLSQYCWLVPNIKDTFLNKYFYFNACGRGYMLHVGWSGQEEAVSFGVPDDCEQPDMYAGNWTQDLCANSPVPQTTDFECRQPSYMENTVIFLGFQSYRRTVSSYLRLFKHEVTFG